jgi:hypothetical protein
VTVTVGLRDAYNVPTAAPKPYDVRIEVLGSPKQVLYKANVIIDRGRDSARPKVALPDVGVLVIKASHPELREGSAFVAVRVRASSRDHQRDTRVTRAGVVRVGHWRSVRTSQAPGVTIALAPPPTPSLSLRYGHEEAKLTANGRDADTIEAFLTEPLATDLVIRLSAPGGTLSKNPIRIPAGDTFGESSLTAPPGPAARTITIRVASVQPHGAANLVEGREARVTFAVAIKEVALDFSPSEVALGFSSRVQACLLGLEGVPVPPDETKELFFNFEKAGVLTPTSLKVTPDAGCAHADFMPQALGLNRFSAWTFGTRTRQESALDVVWPKVALAGLLVGGLLGGLLRAFPSFQGRQPAKGAFEVIGGPIVAAAAFGAALFGLVPKVPIQMVANPLGAFVIAILAAFLGASLVGELAKLILPLPAGDGSAAAENTLDKHGEAGMVAPAGSHESPEHSGQK